MFALATVRHPKSSPLISAREMTQSELKGQENPGQTSGDRLQFPVVQARGDKSQKGLAWLK